MKWAGKARQGSSKATAIRSGWREGMWCIPWIIFRTYPMKIIQFQAPLYSGGCTEAKPESVCLIAAFSVTVWYKTLVLESLKVQPKLVRSYMCFSATSPSTNPRNGSAENLSLVSDRICCCLVLSGVVVGTSISQYLLEKSRVVFQVRTNEPLPPRGGPSLFYSYLILNLLLNNRDGNEY